MKMKIRSFVLVALAIFVLATTFFFARYYKGLSTMTDALQGVGQAELTSLDFKVRQSGTQLELYSSQKSLLRYMQRALSDSREWETEVHGKLERGNSVSLDMVFSFSDGSSYSPDMAVIRNEENLILSVSQFDGWPTHLVKLESPIPFELSDVFLNLAKKESREGDE